MELALSLGGDHSSNPFSNFQNSKTSLLLKSGGGGGNTSKTSNCMGLGLVLCGRPQQADHEEEEEEEEDGNDDVEDDDHRKKEEEEESEEDVDEEEEEEEKNNPVAVQQLDLLPFSPVPRPHQHQIPPHSQFGLRFPWLVSSENILSSEPGSSDGRPQANRLFRDEAVAAAAEDQSSPNSAVSSFMEFTLSYNRNNNNKRPLAPEGIIGSDDPTAERAGASKGSDDDENGSSGTRKKLRLSKDQSAFLEESFKEHHTLNPKQKLALAKQLNLRPRQVEVWFQNRRARTKLKQTEVDCEYLKRCCETLTEENRRLQKELQELRALKTTSHPFYMQHLPATTLTMCPSCERVATTTNTNTNTNTNTSILSNNNITKPTSDGPPTTDLTLLSKPPKQQDEAPQL